MPAPAVTGWLYVAPVWLHVPHCLTFTVDIGQAASTAHSATPHLAPPNPSNPSSPRELSGRRSANTTLFPFPAAPSSKQQPAAQWPAHSIHYTLYLSILDVDHGRRLSGCHGILPSTRPLSSPTSEWDLICTPRSLIPNPQLPSPLPTLS